MKCPNCNLEIQVKQGKKVPYAWCGCGTRVYLPIGAKLDSNPVEDVKIKEEVKDEKTGDLQGRQGDILGTARRPRESPNPAEL